MDGGADGGADGQFVLWKYVVFVKCNPNGIMRKHYDISN